VKKTALALTVGLLLNSGVYADSEDAISIKLEKIGSHQAASYDEGAAEIVAYDQKTQRVFKVNAKASSVQVLDIANPANPIEVGMIDAKAFGASANSVAVKKGIVAVAIESTVKQDNGTVAFYNAQTLALLGSVTVGALPDMVTFSPNGDYALVANEGEPSDDYTNDPEGSVSIIDLRKGVANASVKTADFKAYNGQETALRAQGIRIFGPNATTAQDLEPEYITVTEDSRYAWVSLQEANALAKIDIKNAKVLDIKPLGTKDHSVAGNGIDASDKDKAINIANWPVKGMYMPDGIASYRFRDQTYLVTANEGDTRAYSGFNEEKRVKELSLDATAFPTAAALKADAQLGRLKTTSANGDSDGDGDVDAIYSFGARSFSIWNSQGQQVFDSGADFETITAAKYPDFFNSGHTNNTKDDRSDDKGPEPEGVVLGEINDRTFAFIGLERIGGVMVYDITNPTKATFVDYINNRDFSQATQGSDKLANPAAGDLGPEGLTFIAAKNSPNKKPLLVVGNEVSGTTTVFQINVTKIDDTNHSEDDDKNEVGV
jgi:hypothetical protein